MTKELTKPLPGMAPTGSVSKLLDTFQVDVYGFDDVALDRMPNAEERQLLQARHRELMTMLRPINLAKTDQEKAAKALALLFSGYPSLRNANVRDTITAYMLHLEHLPLPALCKACEDIAHNRVADLDPDFAPTSPRIVKVAEGHIAPLARERDRIDQILGSRKLMRAASTPEAQERVRLGLVELAESMNVSEELRYQKLADEVNKKAAEFAQADITRHYKRAGVEPVKTSWQGKSIVISPSLLMQITKHA